MAERSLAHDAAYVSTTHEQELLDRIEAEVYRLRAKKPEFDYLIDRAVDILLTHLSCPKQRVILVRVGLGGRYKFLMNSMRELGATYVISPSVWACTCPSYHRRGGPCKHALACYVLWRVARPPYEEKACDSCGKVLPRRGLVELHDRNHPTDFPGAHLCRHCANSAEVQW